MVWQKAFESKHKIADKWEDMAYEVIDNQSSLPVYTSKSWKEWGHTWIVHRNLLMHIAHSYKEQLEKESDDSEYDMPPNDEELPSTIPNWPVTHSRMKMWKVTRALALA